MQVFREGRTKAVGNIVKLIPMVSSAVTHGPKIKPIKNQPKHHQAHQPHHSQQLQNQDQPSTATTSNNNASSSTSTTKNENVAPTVTQSSVAEIRRASVDKEKEEMGTDELSDTDLTDLTSEHGQKKRNKRGGRGRHDHGAGRSSSGNFAPLSETNTN